MSEGAVRSFLAALRHDRIAAPRILDGPINGALFLAWVEQRLVPDDPGSHEGVAVRRATRGAGARLLFRPPCSPDPNPRERALTKLKTLLRRADERFVAGWRRIAAPPRRLQPQEALRSPPPRRMASP